MHLSWIAAIKLSAARLPAVKSLTASTGNRSIFRRFFFRPRATYLILFPVLWSTLSVADESNGLDLSASAQLDTIEEALVIANICGSDAKLYIEPDFVLGPELIRGLAVNDLEELLNELEPELEGGRAQSNGRRVILVNGRRIADFREIRSYPPEVIAQVEIYPEEAAAQYGFRANQKVVNLILKARFQAYTSRLASTGYGEEESGEGGEVSQADLG